MNIKKKLISLNSIKLKTLVYLTIFSIFILLFFWEVQMIFFEVFYEKNQLKMMNNIVEEIDDTDLEDLDAKLKDIVYNNNVCIEYTDLKEKNYLYNGNSTGCLLGRKTSFLNEYKKRLIDGDAEIDAIKFVNPDYKVESLLYYINLGNDNYIFIFTMLSDIDDVSVQVRSQLIYLTIMVIFIAIFISLFISKLISKPIVRITNKAKELAKGNYDVVFEKNNILELDELSDALNYLESEVSKTDEYRRDLMANVSHDLKTPLTMIKAYAEMIRDISYKDKKRMNEHLNVIISETDRLNVLVGDILELSKLQTNSDVLNIETFDLNVEIKDIIKKYDLLKETEDYSFDVNMPNKIMVRADKNKINQVLYNLLNNAINYTGEDKRVIIEVIENKRNYLVNIKDTGKGIAKEEIDHIWDRYYKHEKNHKRNVVGTGLGLSIVKNILENHNFKYGVNSDKKEGSCFYFYITKASNVKK